MTGPSNERRAAEPTSDARVEAAREVGVAAARDAAESAAGDTAKELWAELFLERIAPEIKAGLSRQQLQEIRRVAHAVAPGQHRVDLRFSLPLLGPLLGGKRVYGVLLAGAERRAPARRRQDRMIRRQNRVLWRRSHPRAAQMNARILTVGLSLMALFFMALLGLTHAG